MLAARLRKAWDERRESTAIDAVMRFVAEGLVFGAGTVLAPAGDSARDLSIDPLEPRLAALLTAAHLGRPTARALTHLRKAAECWRKGEDALASMHLVLSQLDRLREPEADAHRLFLADSLLTSGVAASVIIDAIEAGGVAFDRLGKRYNPEEPRVPRGSGRTSGQWTTGGGGAPAEVNPSTITPAGNTKGSYQGPDACFKARTDCQVNVSQAQWQGNANGNLDRNLYDQCTHAEWGCIFEQYAVGDTPLFNGGAVLFPDGGVVIVDEGQQPRYYPREIAAGKWPYRRVPKL